MRMTKGVVRPSSARVTSRHKADIHIFGLYTSGTNVLQDALYYTLTNESLSVCPDTRGHYLATGEKTCRGQNWKEHSGKHDYPLDSDVLNFILKQRSPRFKVAFLVRSPFSWLRSIIHSPHQLRPCVEKGWLTQVCECRAMKYGPPCHPGSLMHTRITYAGDWLCTSDNASYKNVVDVWKSYMIAYLEVARRDSRHQSAAVRKYAFVSYRDLIVEPECTMDYVAEALGIPRGSMRGAALDWMERARDSKRSGRHHNDRASMVRDLEERRYLDAFTTWEKDAVCKQLMEGGFPQELGGLLVDCRLRSWAT